MYYGSRTEFETLAKGIGIMEDFKVLQLFSRSVAYPLGCLPEMLECSLHVQSGVPRTAYKGVVMFHYGEASVYLRPKPGYDPETAEES
jgi:hypothetical protein